MYNLISTLFLSHLINSNQVFINVSIYIFFPFLFCEYLVILCQLYVCLYMWLYLAKFKMQCDNCYVCVYLCLYSLSNFFFLFPFLCVLYELQCLTSNKNIFHKKKKKKKKWPNYGLDVLNITHAYRSGNTFNECLCVVWEKSLWFT